MFFTFSNGAAQAPQAFVPAQYSAVAIGRSGPTIGKTFDLIIRVNEVTSDADVDRLIAALKQKGQDGFMSIMEDMKDVGRIAPASGVGTAMRVVLISSTADGGQHIVMATNRPLALGELYNGTRSLGYPVGIVVLDVDKNGKGTGSFAPLCKVGFDENKQLQVENYGQKPFRLTGVFRQK
jgi:hypothetical protein